MILLVPAYNLQNSLVISSLLLVKHHASVCSTEQAIGSADHFKFVICHLLSRVVNDQQTDPIGFRETLELPGCVIVVCVAVIVGTLSDALQRVDYYKAGIGMLLHELVQLLGKAFSQLLGCNRKVKLFSSITAKHAEQPRLKSLIIILQRQIQNCALSHRITPQWLPGADMISDLRNQEGFPTFGAPANR